MVFFVCCLCFVEFLFSGFLGGFLGGVFCMCASFIYL